MRSMVSLSKLAFMAGVIADVVEVSVADCKIELSTKTAAARLPKTKTTKATT